MPRAHDIYNGEILELEFLDANILKRVLVVLLSICTAGLFALVLYWYPSFRVKCWYGERRNSKKLGADFKDHLLAGRVSAVLIVDNQEAEIVSSMELHTDAKGQVVASFAHNEIYYDCFPNTGDLRFLPRVFNFCLPQSDIISKFNQGLKTDSEVTALQESFGPCEIRVQVPHALLIIMRVLITPFYIF